MAPALLERRPHGLLRRLGVPVAAAIELAARWSSRRVGLALMYHRVGDPQGDPERELVPALGTALFEAQMRRLRRRYDVVAASELPAATRARRRGGRFPVAITFDDDHPSHVRTTLPVLRRLGLRATFFLCRASLEQPARFWWDDLQEIWDAGGTDPAAALGPAAIRVSAAPGDPRRLHEVAETIQVLEPAERRRVVERLRALAPPDAPEDGMTAADVAELVAAGCEIGWHTRDHEPLPTLDDASLARSLEEGREALERLAGRPLRAFAYPHGHVDARVAAAVRTAGFEVAYTIVPEAVLPESDPMLLGRLRPSFVSEGHFALQLARRLVPRLGRR